MKLKKKVQCALAALLMACATGTEAKAQATAVPLVGTIGTPVTVVNNHTGLTLNGAVGNILNPTANIPNEGGWRVQGDYVDLGDVEADSNNPLFSGDLGDLKFYGAHANARPWSAPVELSVGIEKLRGRGNRLSAPGFVESFSDLEGLDKVGAAVGAKWQVWRSQEGDAFVAVGAGHSRALFNNTHAYVVGTKAFSVGRRAVTGHLGMRYDRFDFKVTGRVTTGGVVTGVQEVEDESSRASIFAAAEVPLDRQGKWSFIGELQSRNSDDLRMVFPAVTFTIEPRIPYSAAIRFANNGWSASAGVARQGVTGDSGLFAQIGKTF